MTSVHDIQEVDVCLNQVHYQPELSLVMVLEQDVVRHPGTFVGFNAEQQNVIDDINAWDHNTIQSFVVNNEVCFVLLSSKINHRRHYRLYDLDTKVFIFHQLRELCENVEEEVSCLPDDEDCVAGLVVVYGNLPAARLLQPV